MAKLTLYKDSLDIFADGAHHVSVSFENDVAGIDISVDTLENLFWFSLSKEDSKKLAEKLLEFAND